MTAPRLVFLVLVIMSVGLVSCDDNSVCPEPSFSITGRVLYAGSMNVAENARIYIAYGSSIDFTDTTGTDSRGAFMFEGDYEGEFCLFAGKPENAISSSFSYVSPISEIMDNSGHTVFCAGDMLLYEVLEMASVTGHVTYGETPAEGADVTLYSRSAGDYFLPDATVTDAQGNYAFSDVMTGNYTLFSCKEGLAGETDIFFCDGISAYKADPIYLEDNLVVEKPAIYIYTGSDQYFQVRLDLADGTELTSSIPEYGSGWNVFVETTGLIDHRYDYLFYEASIRKVPDLSRGWCISRSALAGELQVILSDLGLNEKESEDFLEHWLNRLTEHEYYSVYPLVDNSLDQYVELSVIPEPDAQLRFWLFFEGYVNSQVLPTPILSDFQRKSTTVVEWGGALLN